MVITATEFKMNMGKYLDYVQKEDIFITKNGKTIAKLSNPNINPVDFLSGLLQGKLADNYDKQMLKEERLEKYEDNN